MDCNHKGKQKSKKFDSASVLTVIAILMITGGLSWYYTPHLFWAYTWWQYGKPELDMIPHSLMPEIDIPEDWMEHTLGNLRFHLPPDMSLVEDESNQPKQSLFRNDKITAYLSRVPQFGDVNGRTEKYLQAASRLHPAQKTFLSNIQLTFEALNVRANDFRWSMSRQEAQWHFFIVDIRHSTLSASDIKSVEYFAGKNADGLLIFRSGEVSDDNSPIMQSCIVYWQCAGNLDIGTINIVVFGESKFDYNVVRGIVQSMEINNGCLSNDK